MHYIKDDTRKSVLNETEVQKLGAFIRNLDNPQEYPLKFNVSQIIDDFTDTLITLEKCAAFVNNEEIEDFSDIYAAIGVEKSLCKSNTKDEEFKDIKNEKSVDSRTNPKDTKNKQHYAGWIATVITLIVAGISTAAFMKKN